MEYRRLGAHQGLPATTLCAISFGAQRRVESLAPPQALRVHVDLPTLLPTGLMELWHADGPVELGRDGIIQYAVGGHYLAGQVLIDEHAVGGLAAAANAAYDAISRFTLRGSRQHLLRMYGHQFRGGRRGTLQAVLQWPRAGLQGAAGSLLAGSHGHRTPGSQPPAAGVLARQ